jgi:hypothetical protein
VANVIPFTLAVLGRLRMCNVGVQALIGSSRCLSNRMKHRDRLECGYGNGN